MKARQTVATAAIVSVTVIILAELDNSGELPQASQLVGFAVVFTFLSVLADFNLEFAGGLGLIAMVAILFGPQPGRGRDNLSPIEHALHFLGQRGGS